MDQKNRMIEQIGQSARVTIDQIELKKSYLAVKFVVHGVAGVSTESFDIQLKMPSAGGLRLDEGVRDACEIFTHLLAMASERSRQLTEELNSE